MGTFRDKSLSIGIVYPCYQISFPEGFLYLLGACQDTSVHAGMAQQLRQPEVQDEPPPQPRTPILKCIGPYLFCIYSKEYIALEI